MEFSPRRTRQHKRRLLANSQTSKSLSRDDPNHNTEAIINSETLHEASINESQLVSIPQNPGPKLTKLSRTDHTLLLLKQDLLRKYAISIPKDFQKHSNADAATLVFAQKEAGTAVCIQPDGLVLTCSHCVAETAADLDLDAVHWLLFASGRIVSATCVAGTKFPSVSVAEQAPSVNSRLVCIGHPGSEDLEAGEPGVKTNYDVLHLSTGVYRGIAEGQDVQNNADIDDETGMRRGVPLEAIREFLKRNC
ncbi:hypothetical protein B0T17DRAFT_587608 [Bombardia bombarda]|uniref:Uncharacterized protein n=1 Tax=Bombardia bombarda TaxID=252184 RepID=A0AA40CFC3_9PEZI|nr:hypothetical protein B0T17DRAFT_587608 [Bombardia bombarda]